MSIILAVSNETTSDSYTWELSDGDTEESIKFDTETGDKLVFELDSSSTEVTVELYKEKFLSSEKIKTWSGKRKYTEELQITENIAGFLHFKVSNPGAPYGDKTNVSFWFQVISDTNDNENDPILLGLLFLGIAGFSGLIFYRWKQSQQNSGGRPPM